MTQVRGFADQRLRVKADPLDPANRRISLIVQYLDKKNATPTTEVKPGDAKPADLKPVDTKPADVKPPDEPAKPAENPTNKK